jgi:hypothetical protein
MVNCGAPMQLTEPSDAASGFQERVTLPIANLTTSPCVTGSEHRDVNV